MIEKTTIRPSAEPDGPLSRLAPLAFGLGVVSVLVYFVTSEGIHNFVVYLMELATNALGRHS